MVDIDTHRSKVGKRFIPFSWLTKLFFRHRGLFHSIFFVLIIYIALTYLGWYTISFAFLLGYLSHIALDAITKSGVQIFWPLRKKIRGPIQTNSMLEKVLFTVLLLADVYLILNI
jgi:inner membrane protein